VGAPIRPHIRGRLCRLDPASDLAREAARGGPVLRNLIHPGSYDLSTGEYLTSYTTGLPAESVMNFGLGGLLFVPFIYGFALFGIAKLSLKVRTSLHFVTWMLALFLVAYGYLAGEFFGTCSWLVAYIFPLLLLIGMYRHSRKRIYRTCSEGTML